MFRYAALSLLLAGCSTPMHDESLEKIISYGEGLPYANMLLSGGSYSPTIIVLAVSEVGPYEFPASPMLKWVLNRDELIVTQSGRITKTIIGGKANLFEHSSAMGDPLAHDLSDVLEVAEYRFNASWSGYDNIAATSTFERVEKGYWREMVNYVTGHKVVNEYWFKEGSMVRSKQYPVPTLPAIELSVINEFEVSR